MTELKNLQCHGMTTMGTALKHVFDLLNINRIQSGIDNYGSGRCPYFLEPVVIVVITDGGRLTNNNGVQDEVSLLQFVFENPGKIKGERTSKITSVYILVQSSDAFTSSRVRNDHRTFSMGSTFIFPSLTIFRYTFLRKRHRART